MNRRGFLFSAPAFLAAPAILRATSLESLVLPQYETVVTHAYHGWAEGPGIEGSSKWMMSGTCRAASWGEAATIIFNGCPTPPYKYSHGMGVRDGTEKLETRRRAPLVLA
jgi:hypothetical protein